MGRQIDIYRARGERGNSKPEPAQADRGAGGGHATTCPNSTASMSEEDLGSTVPWIAPSGAGSSTDTPELPQAKEHKKEGGEVAELLRSHTEETLAAVEQAYGEEGSPDQHERDRRAEGEERTTGTKAATRAAAAAEHIQEALQLARSIELHGVEAHLSAAATSLSLAAERTSGETWAAAAERFPDSSPGGGDPGRTSPTWRPADSRGAGRRGEQPMQHTCCGQDGTCAISYPSSWTRTQGRPHRRHSKSSTTGHGSTGDQNSWKSWTTTGRTLLGGGQNLEHHYHRSGERRGGQTLMYTYNRRCLRKKN